jgi:hypothetical protein
MSLASTICLLQVETEQLDFGLKESIYRLERSLTAAGSHQAAAHGLASEAAAAVKNTSRGINAVLLIENISMF